MKHHPFHVVGNNEPYLRLPPPHSNIIITPPRLTDAHDITVILNDEPVYKWLSGPPYPFFLEDAESWLAEMKVKSDSVLKELREAEGDELKLFDWCPVQILREVKEDGTQVFLGDMSFRRCFWDDELDLDKKKRLLEENESRLAGDPGIVWAPGDYLAASHHGKGIMTAALQTLMKEWAIPRMGMRHMRVNTFIGNWASVRVFEKNGFVLVKSVEDCIVVRGTKVGLHVMEWTLEDPE